MALDLRRLIQDAVAERAIGPSTLRNQGSPGVVSRARVLLKRLDLGRFAACSSATFGPVLDRETLTFQGRLPSDARHWGTARKALSIFLRDATYNHYLRKHYGLASIEAWLEIPLDQDTAAGLRRDAPGSELPRWPGIIHLTPEVCANYQGAASLIARRLKEPRVHLDLKYWRHPYAMKQ